MNVFANSLWLLILCGIAAASVLAGEHFKIPQIFENPLDSNEPLVDDARFYAKPGITTAEMLTTRGYVARKYQFVTRDGYVLSLVRGTNPLINNGERGLDSKQPILFVNAATLSCAGYLINSVGVRPRFHRLDADLNSLSAEQLKELLQDEPAVRSLPFLALNLGYEVWMLDRRGFLGPRHKIGNEKRTLADAWKAVPQTLLGNALDGFTLDANMKQDRPARTETHARDTERHPENGTIEIMEGKAGEAGTGDLFHSDRVKRLRKRNLLTGAQSEHSENILQLMFKLVKFPGSLKRLGDIKREFIETFDPDFWRFSLDEQAEMDLPEAIDYVLEITGKRKLHAVGLSCGGAIILLALAEQPQLARKISRAVLWAPSVIMGSKSDMVHQLSQLVPLVQSYTGPLPFVFMHKEVQYWLQKLCAYEIMQRTVCAAITDALGGFSNGQGPLRPNMLATMLTPTGINEAAHLGQMARTKGPCKFNMNTVEKNLEMYGQKKPPCYDLASIELRNMSFYVGAYDTLVSPDDIASVVLQMKVASELHIIKGKNLYFNHFGAMSHRDNDVLAILPSMLDIERSDAQDRFTPAHDPSFNAIL